MTGSGTVELVVETPRVAKKLDIPEFASEAEEAQWWYDHRDELTEAFEVAGAQGELRHGSAAQIARERAGAATPTTIRLDPEDASRARALAAKRGFDYPAYLKMLLHEALDAEQKKLAG